VRDDDVMPYKIQMNDESTVSVPTPVSDQSLALKGLQQQHRVTQIWTDAPNPAPKEKLNPEYQPHLDADELRRRLEILRYQQTAGRLEHRWTYTGN
jgi:hypothetical protein